jgi:hypothetical protein
MGRWFQNLPLALEDMIGTVKFQHETMSNLLRFYKSKCLNQKELIERLRRELDAIKVSGTSFITWLTTYFVRLCATMALSFIYYERPMEIERCTQMIFFMIRLPVRITLDGMDSMSTESGDE